LSKVDLLGSDCLDPHAKGLLSELISWSAFNGGEKKQSSKAGQSREKHVKFPESRFLYSGKYTKLLESLHKRKTQIIQKTDIGDNREKERNKTAVTGLKEVVRGQT